MGCYEPLLRTEDLFKWVTAKDGHQYHPATVKSLKSMVDFNNENKWAINRLIDDTYKIDFGSYDVLRYKTQIIPCGQCIGCRLDNSLQWANRGYLESLYNEHNYFITLTYDDEFLPVPEYIETSDEYIYDNIGLVEWKGTLIPEDLKLFIKNIRQIMKRKYKVKGIRYLACGEYGSKGRRPHFHLILFNCPLPIETFYDSHVTFRKDVYWKNDIINEAWTEKGADKPRGIADVSVANWETIAYTARYITKKINGNGSEHQYAKKGQIKEFLRVSTRPGIARPYYEDHFKDIYSKDQIMVVKKDGVHYNKPPKYFDRIFKKEYPEIFEEIKEERNRKFNNMLKIKDSQTTISLWEQLQIERDSKAQSALALTRANCE